MTRLPNLPLLPAQFLLRWAPGFDEDGEEEETLMQLVGATELERRTYDLCLRVERELPAGDLATTIVTVLSEAGQQLQDLRRAPTPPAEYDEAVMAALDTFASTERRLASARLLSEMDTTTYAQRTCQAKAQAQATITAAMMAARVPSL